MPLEHWKAAEKELASLFTILEKNRDYIVVENAEEWDDDEKPPTLQPGEKYIKVPGSIVSYVERLDDELIRSLQSIDPHTSEYIERLQDEGSLYNIIFQGLLYYEHLRKDEALEVPQDSINRIVMRRLEHVYFKVSHTLSNFIWILLIQSIALSGCQDFRGELLEGCRRQHRVWHHSSQRVPGCWQPGQCPLQLPLQQQRGYHPCPRHAVSGVLPRSSQRVLQGS